MNVSSSSSAPYAESVQSVLTGLGASVHGLSHGEADARLHRYGPNTLPRARVRTVPAMFVQQFKSPLIYVLLLASVVSCFLGDWTDAAFIFAVLLLNAGVGTFQEYRAERSAQALQAMVAPRARVVRDHDTFEVSADSLVPGDVVLLESGAKVPADLRLLDVQNLSVDESMLTGESLASTKQDSVILSAQAPLAEQSNMAFAGTLVNSGRGRGVITATGTNTELGQIANAVLGRPAAKAPLIVRMERFTRMVAVGVGLAALLLVGVALARGDAVQEIFLLAVALAVSAIPEGLPVALTVALSVGMERMARRSVIVRRLLAVEALGSCTYIASDKTGTLTVNQLTVRRVQFPKQAPWDVGGEGLVPEGAIIPPQDVTLEEHGDLLEDLARIAVLANEATLAHRDGEWVGHGDSVDLALLVLAHKAGLSQVECQNDCAQIAEIPYESERRCSASLNRFRHAEWAFVKGAADTLLPMCTQMNTPDGPVPIDSNEVLAQVEGLAAQGYRVMAVASGPVRLAGDETFSMEHLRGLRFAGLLAMSDPPRAEARQALEACRRAGITVGMVTGDHPVTALAVARDLGLADDPQDVVRGSELAEAWGRGEDDFDALCARGRVFARVEPEQKLRIVESLQRMGHFVAVTGDGVNDAPALRAAQVGVAMGWRGTDVARETSDIVITDDNFASIVAGIEEGRIAYGNVRKVIFLLISTGAAEIVLFALALLAGLSLPLTAVQLLWLNLVTNGIQDVALAFEPAEGQELDRPPRAPTEGVFNRLMLERVLLSAAFIGGAAFLAYRHMLLVGHTVDEARNAVLVLMVLFENVQALNSRSETLSVFVHAPMRNKLLLISILAAQAFQVGAMHMPVLQNLLSVAPVSVLHWVELLTLALGLLLVMEGHKLHLRRVNRRKLHGGATT